jgi:undecaprenyl-diphosphatase
MAALSLVGGGWGALALVPMLLWERTRRVGRSLAGVLAVTAVTVFSLKAAFHRVRPCYALPHVRPLVFDAPTDFSFPSGHAAGSFAVAVFLAVLLIRSPRAGAVAAGGRSQTAAAIGLLLFACGVGLSRIALGVHFPADVLAGAALGTTIAGVGARLHLA